MVMEIQGYKSNRVIRKNESPKLITELPNELTKIVKWEPGGLRPTSKN